MGQNTDCDFCNGMGFLPAEKAAGMKDITVNGMGLPLCPVCKGKRPVVEKVRTVPAPTTHVSSM
jgi:hypothetical protein